MSINNEEILKRRKLYIKARTDQEFLNRMAEREARISELNKQILVIRAEQRKDFKETLTKYMMEDS